jgi:hypothetical protein
VTYHHRTAALEVWTYRVECGRGPHELECYSRLELNMGHVLGRGVVGTVHTGGPATAWSGGD